MRTDHAAAVADQYGTPEKLDTRIAIHEKYSTNRQGFGNWIVSHYRIKDGAAVLELGCGTGAMWLGREALIGKCARLVLSDLSGGMLLKARETLGCQKGIEYRRIDIRHIPYEDRTFDAVIANMMLYHVPELRQALGEVSRVLKDDGAFYSATYGENGMMKTLCGMFRKYGISGQSDHSFTLQNGGELLKRFFSEVRRYDYEDSLEVTDAGDMADYIRSLSGMTELRRLPREVLLSVLKENMTGGVLHIPKEYGLFVSSRKYPADPDGRGRAPVLQK